MSYTKEQVKAAVNDPTWQDFRKQMKGLTTREKLAVLKSYFNEGLSHYEGVCTDEDCELPQRDEEVFLHYCIRIDNYIKALCRGGQLRAGHSIETAIECNFDVAEMTNGDDPA